jgi:hypothetical protein
MPGAPFRCPSYGLSRPVLAPQSPPRAPATNGTSRAAMPEAVRMVPRLWGAWFWTLPGTWGSATPESWSIKLAPAMAPEIASTRITTSESTGSEISQSEASEGLRLALENLVRISVPRETQTSISLDGDEAHLPDYTRDQLYLILREGVRNVVAHADAERMEVEVGITQDEVTAVIVDAGMGLMADQTVLTEGPGISSMRERAELLGGSFVLSSDPDGGTRIEVRLPLGRRR